MLAAVFTDGAADTMKIVQAEERVACELIVNGERERVHVEPSRLLCDVLRDDLGLTGVKVACGMANCGACTVLVDGRPVYSCITLALDCEGRAITTIEGLSKGNDLHPVQQAFIKYDALQCGFCTPGQILTMSAFLEKKSAPTEDEIRQAMSGNLCRCGAYVKILEAGMKTNAQTR
jgi:aerobic-type carbon monoxide dehydrogenase small subunit (CoxS/CutS family)